MVKQISIGLRDEQLDTLSILATKDQVSQAEIVRRLIDDAHKNRSRLHDLSLAFLRGHITENEFAREVSLIILMS